jgi:hypothetical protein
MSADKETTIVLRTDSIAIDGTGLLSAFYPQLFD